MNNTCKLLTVMTVLVTLNAEAVNLPNESELLRQANEQIGQKDPAARLQAVEMLIQIAAAPSEGFSFRDVESPQHRATNTLISLLDDLNPDVQLEAAEFLNARTALGLPVDDKIMERTSLLLLEATPPRCSWYLVRKFFDPIFECRDEIANIALFQRAAEVVLEGDDEITKIAAAKRVLELQDRITDQELIQSAKTVLQQKR